MLDEGQQALAARSDYNFDHPDAFDFELLVSVLRKLKKGKSVKVPVYDFTTHSRRREWVGAAGKPGWGLGGEAGWAPWGEPPARGGRLWSRGREHGGCGKAKGGSVWRPSGVGGSFWGDWGCRGREGAGRHGGGRGNGGQRRVQGEAAVQSVEECREDGGSGGRRWAEVWGFGARVWVLGQCRAGLSSAGVRKRALEGWVMQDGNPAHGWREPGMGQALRCLLSVPSVGVAAVCARRQDEYGSYLPTENGVWGQCHRV